MNQAEGDIDRYIRARFFPTQNTGVFVDVGAARPDFLSISALFRSIGWTIFAIEPNPAFCEFHRRLGYEVLQYACGDHDEDDVDFSVVDLHEFPYMNGAVTNESFSSLGFKDEYSKLRDKHADWRNIDIKKIKVKLRRLDTILQTHAPHIDHIDVLSIDVEGWELEVIAGLDLHRFKPRVMVIENLFDYQSYREYMGRNGYTLWKYSPPNDVYIRNDKIESRPRARGV